MLGNDLQNKLLIEPGTTLGFSRLSILTGYASYNWARHHLADLLPPSSPVQIDLTIGMTALSGVSERDHWGYQDLEKRYPGRFKCAYLRKDKKAIHSKLYLWRGDNGRNLAFIGSANYSFNAFTEITGELVEQTTDALALNYLESAKSDSVSCSSPEVFKSVDIWKSTTPAGQNWRVPPPPPGPGSSGRFKDFDLTNLPKLSVSLLARGGVVHSVGGLNWGFRETANRNRNEAYIQLGRSIGSSNFFPPKPTRFEVYTDNGVKLTMVRASKSASGDQLATPEGNAVLGAYFRERLGLSSGQFVTLSDLKNYGRTSVDFYSLSDGSYFMDFS